MNPWTRSCRRSCCAPSTNPSRCCGKSGGSCAPEVDCCFWSTCVPGRRDWLAGKTVWHVNLQEKYGSDRLNWDLGTSPVLTKDLVVVAVMHQGPSYLAALNKTTGEVVWKQDRDLGAPRRRDAAAWRPYRRNFSLRSCGGILIKPKPNNQTET